MSELGFTAIVLVTWNHSSGNDLIVERNGKGEGRIGCAGRNWDRYVNGMVNLEPMREKVESDS